MRKLLFSAAVALLTWAAAVVPLPILALSPVQAQPVTSIIQLAERPDRLGGELLFTGVRAERTTTVGAVATWMDEHREIAIGPLLAPGGDGEGDFAEFQREIFRESVDVAAAVAMREAGMDVEIEGGGAEVVQVAPGTPAHGELQEGDVITRVDDRRIRLATEFSSVTAGMRPGEEVEITFERGSGQRTVTLELIRLPQTDEAGIGVATTTVDLRIDLPIEVIVPPEAPVGGSSAGLMLALTIYDLVDDTDLAEASTVAGTGAIDLSGDVHAVSGIAEKVRGAELAGADVFLVPADRADEARRAAPDDLRIEPIADLGDALSVLTS